MNAKHSAILLSGLLLLMIGLAWAQTANTPRPSCPPVTDEFLQKILQEQPEAWARADWNADSSRWEIDCSQIDALANMEGRPPANASNTAANATNAANVRRPTRSVKREPNTRKPGN